MINNLLIYINYLIVLFIKNVNNVILFIIFIYKNDNN